MKRTAALLPIAFCTILLAAPLCGAADSAPGGGELFRQKCASCHPSPSFRPNEKVSSLDGLKAQVEACAQAGKAGWGAEEIGKVTAYLNDTFYKFPGK